MRKHYVIFDKTTGIISAHLLLSEEHLPGNLSDTTDAIEGSGDPLSQKVDVAAVAELRAVQKMLSTEPDAISAEALQKRIDELKMRLIVSYEPPQPSADHEWNTETKRWQLKQDVVERNVQRADAQAQLEALDPKELRAVSDLLADPNDKAAQERLADIRAQKETLRAEL